VVNALLIAAGSLLQVAGVVGCVLPALPGPPLNWLGFLLLRLALHEPPSWTLVGVLGVVAGVATALDYVVPARGAKKAGATRLGVWGSVLGMIIGMIWFPPFGMIVGAFVGAVAGELILSRATGESFKAGWGVLVGTMQGILLKLVASGVIAFYFVQAVF
jgi:uncharacterized protein YqgC (DUF456 family)